MSDIRWFKSLIYGSLVGHTIVQNSLDEGVHEEHEQLPVHVSEEVQNDGKYLAQLCLGPSPLRTRPARAAAAVCLRVQGSRAFSQLSENYGSNVRNMR